MCAHLQPQAASIQRENPEYWYIQALYAALITLNTDLDSRASVRVRNPNSRLRESFGPSSRLGRLIRRSSTTTIES
jgi:hypothetical protein